jgi:mutator protein MutT
MNHDSSTGRTRRAVEVGLGAVLRPVADAWALFGNGPGPVEVLITRRPEGTVVAGWWELPGGKIHEGETPEGCVVRELFEELGIAVEILGALPEVVHTYEHATVRLHPRICRLAPGSRPARNLGVAEHRWCRAADLGALRFLPANAPIISAISARLGSPA